MATNFKRIPLTKHSFTPTRQSSKEVRPIDSDEDETETSASMKPIVLVLAVLVLLGVGTGYILSRGSLSLKFGGKSTTTGSAITSNGSNTKTVGVSDTKTFSDSATGTVQAGGIDGEGTHQLVREGGPSQTVYLISSVVDLDQFIGKKVKVWGQTIAAKKAAWLMDVGKVEQQ
jgi:hypothetical protein